MNKKSYFIWSQNSLNKILLQIRKMPKTNIKSFKFVKLVLLMLFVVIVLTVITVGLIILWSQKSKESTPKRNESMPEEKHFKSILSLIINSYFFCLKILFLNWTRNENIIHRINILFFYKEILIKNLRKIFFYHLNHYFVFFIMNRKLFFLSSLIRFLA